ncbi:hypothetical protein ACGE24_09265 [Corynebacterium kroppenstedtii]
MTTPYNLTPIPGFTLLHHVCDERPLLTPQDDTATTDVGSLPRPQSSSTTSLPVTGGCPQGGGEPPRARQENQPPSSTPVATPSAVIRRLVTIALETASGHRPPSKLSADDFGPVVRQSLTTLSRLSSSPHPPLSGGRLIMVHCSTNTAEGDRPRFVEFCGTWRAESSRSGLPSTVRVLAGKAAKSRTSYRITTLRFM